MAKRTTRARALIGTVAAGALALGVVTQAGAATQVFPENGGFDGSAAPWTESASATGDLLTLLADANNSYAGGVGVPPGSVSANFKVVLNVLNLLARGKSTWSSAPFEITGPVDEATFSFQRKAAIKPLLEVGGVASASAVLVDLGTGAEFQLAKADLTSSDDAFTAVVGAVPDGALEKDHKYRIDLRTKFSSLATVLGSSSVFYDNVKLKVDDGKDDDGDNGDGDNGDGNGKPKPPKPPKK